MTILTEQLIIEGVGSRVLDELRAEYERSGPCFLDMDLRMSFSQYLKHTRADAVIASIFPWHGSEKGYDYWDNVERRFTVFLKQ